MGFCHHCYCKTNDCFPQSCLKAEWANLRSTARRWGKQWLYGKGGAEDCFLVRITVCKKIDGLWRAKCIPWFMPVSGNERKKWARLPPIHAGKDCWWKLARGNQGFSAGENLARCRAIAFLAGVRLWSQNERLDLEGFNKNSVGFLICFGMERKDHEKDCPNC